MEAVLTAFYDALPALRAVGFLLIAETAIGIELILPFDMTAGYNQAFLVHIFIECELAPNVMIAVIFATASSA